MVVHNLDTDTELATVVADRVAHDRLADVQSGVVDKLDNFALPDIDMRSAVDDRHQHAAAVDSCLEVDRNSLAEVALHFDHTYSELVHLVAVDMHQLLEPVAVVVRLLAMMQPLAERPMVVTFVKSVSDFAFDNWLEYVHL